MISTINTSIHLDSTINIAVSGEVGSDLFYLTVSLKGEPECIQIKEKELNQLIENLITVRNKV